MDSYHSKISVSTIRNIPGLSADIIENVIGEDEDYDETKWRLSYLRNQFPALELQNLFKTFINKINHGFFSLFLILHTVLSLTHFFVLFFSIYSSDDAIFRTIIPDLIIYFFNALLAVMGVALIDRLVKKNMQMLTYLSNFAFFLLMFSNFFVPIYHYLMENGNLRPAYTTHLIICCYIFFNYHDNLTAILLGVFVSVSHLAVLGGITYEGDKSLWHRLLSDGLFLFCLNGVGLNVRYMNEVSIRRGFLDRRHFYYSTLQIKAEKEQEDQLISSIMTNTIADKFKKHYRENMDDILETNRIIYEPLDTKFLEVHENVSILFADIVHYTEMTSKLNIIDLLETLNELFGRFDDASQELNVTRIKFLGDCYYCCAGLPPNPAPNHGEACVDLGLKMIAIIARIRKKRNLNINMRIGVHTGTVISNVMGSVKYQFDIWSKDVDLANKMETEGSPGKVHITNATKNLLTKKYDLEETDKGESVEQFRLEGIKTFLVTPQQSDEVDSSKAKVTFQDETVSARPSIFMKKSSGFNGASTTSNSSSKIILDQLYEGNELDQNAEVEPTSRQNTVESISNSATTPRPSIFIKKSATVNGTSNNSKIILEQLYDDQNSDEPSTSKPTSRQNTVDRISTRSTFSIPYQINDSGTTGHRRNTVSRRGYGSNPMITNSLKKISRISAERRLTEENKRRTAFMNMNLNRHKLIMKDVQKEMEAQIQNLSFSKYQQFFYMKHINCFSLFFQKLSDEWLYMKMPDPLFKHYLLIDLFIVVCTFVLQNLTLSRWEWTAWPFYVTLALILFFLPLTWTHFIWRRYVLRYKHEDESEDYGFFIKTSLFITQNFWMRLAIYFTVTFFFGFYVLSQVIDCENFYVGNSKPTKESLFRILFRDLSDEDLRTICVIPWHMTETCSMAMLMTFSFLRTVIWIKLSFSSVIALFYSISIYTISTGFYKNSETFNYMLEPQTSHVLSVIFLAFTLHLIDRQNDYMSRLDFLRTQEIVLQEDEAKKLNLINKSFLYNILPVHVAKEYLDISRGVDEIYHEKHADVAVMFASMILEDSSDIDDKDILILINSYIHDFDTISRSRNFFEKIEKIKMSKWTYMAASGLAPGQNNSDTEVHTSNSSVLILLEFAAKIMQKTIKPPTESFSSSIQLRIGICHGPIVAGVVGSKKPLYDIWGDAVNMASRMDSTGVVGRIQIMEETANVVESLGYEVEYRGEIKVKGREGLVKTYFVPLDESYNLIKKPRD